MLQEEWESSLQTTTASSIAKGKGVAGRTPSSPGVRFSTSKLTDNHRRIRMRLSALLPIEDELMKKLLPDGGAANKDVCVRAGSGWKGIVSALSENTSTLGPVVPVKPLVSAMKGSANSRPNTADARFKDNPTAVLAACKDDIVTLWEDHIVQDVLKKHNMRLQDMPGFFLNDAGRIAAINFEPSDGMFGFFCPHIVAQTGSRRHRPCASPYARCGRAPFHNGERCPSRNGVVHLRCRWKSQLRSSLPFLCVSHKSDES